MSYLQHNVKCPAPRPMPHRAHWNPEHIGVTTSENSMYQMSCMDRMQAQRHNPVWRSHGNPAPHQYEAFEEELFSYRTCSDKAQLQQFNPQYRNNPDVKEAYVVSCGTGDKGGGYQPRHSKLLDDPYQPYSYRTTYPSIQ